MRLPYCLSIILYMLWSSSLAQTNTDHDSDILMYSYFKGNGEDGLHLAYSLDGYDWNALNNDRSFLTPQAGQDKLMRDPCIIRGGDGKFHMVWTVSWNEKGIGYANSKDLIHWSEQRFLPVMMHEENARNCWAPEIFYDEAEDIYMIFWSSTITGLYPETQSTEDKGYNHRMYYVTSKDLTNFSETKLLYEPGFNVIDGTIIKNGDRFIMFLKDETRTPPEKNIKMATSNHLTGGFTKASNPLTGAYWAEGPSAIKIKDLWIIYFDKYIDKQMGAIASSDLQNWTDISNDISFPKGTRHGTVFTVTQKEFDKLQAVKK